MITHFDFGTGQVVDDGQAQAAIPLRDTLTPRLRLLTLDEARANEQRHHHFDNVIVDSLVARLDD